MYQGKVVICGVNTSELKVLSEEEKKALLIKIKNGDADAREEMISGNLRLVLSVVQRFAQRSCSLDDLFQVGCIGLVKAVDNFDVTKEVMFSTYAVPMIIGEIRRYLRDNASIRISRSVRDLAYRALSAREELSATLEREPTADEIAKFLDVPRSQVVHAMEAIIEPISLYEPVFNDNGDALYVIDKLCDSSKDSTDESWLENIALKEALSGLSQREQAIINMRFYKDKTQMEIASEIGISQAQVSRLEKAALEKLKKQL